MRGGVRVSSPLTIQNYEKNASYDRRNDEDEDDGVDEIHHAE